jgi:hypothetical protein
MSSYEFSGYLDAMFPIPPMEEVTPEAFSTPKFSNARAWREEWAKRVARLSAKCTPEMLRAARFVRGDKTRWLVLSMVLAGRDGKAEVSQSGDGRLLRVRIPVQNVGWWEEHVYTSLPTQSAVTQALWRAHLSVRIDGSITYSGF